jgi:hypothetical protein
VPVDRDVATREAREHAGPGAADLANDRVEAVIRGQIELHPAGTKRRLTG